MRPYDQLTDTERLFVDDLVRKAFLEAKSDGLKLLGDDRCERAVDALATWVIESR